MKILKLRGIKAAELFAFMSALDADTDKIKNPPSYKLRRIFGGDGEIRTRGGLLPN